MSILAMFVILNSFFVGIAPIIDSTPRSQVMETPQEVEVISEPETTDSFEPRSTEQSVERAPVDFRSLMKSYSEIPMTVTHRLLTGTSSNGLDFVYDISDSTLTIRVDIDSYSLATYTFDEGEFQALMMPGAQLSTIYGSPVVPYKNFLIGIPAGASVVDVDLVGTKSETLSQLYLVPGPKPVAIYEGVTIDNTLFFDPEVYEQDMLTDAELVDYQLIHQRGEDGLFLTVKPLQYNPVKCEGVLNSEIVIEVKFDTPVSFGDLSFNGGGASNANYTIIIEPGFEAAIADFVVWKTSLGFNVFVETSHH